MKKFIKYVLSFEPDFLEKVEGATPEEIETLERTIGFPLPQQYKEFLLLMGKNTANFKFVAGEAKSNINEVREFYEEIRTHGDPIPENYVVIAVGNYMHSICILRGGRQDRVMLLLYFEKIVSYVAENLEIMLLKMAFKIYNFPSFPHRRNYADARNKEKRLLLAENIAKELGFQILWFSDAVEICGERDNAVISIFQSQHEGIAIGGINVYVWAKSEREAREIGDVFAERLRLKLLH